MFAFALGDFMKPPVAHAIDATAITGRCELPRVEASDDFEVVAVVLVILDATDAVLLQGPAEPVEGRWTYVARAMVGSGESVTI